MKTNERMTFALIGAAVCSLCFGLGQRQTSAGVDNCVRSCCEPLYAWWFNGAPGGTKCFSAQVTGSTYPFAAGANTTTALVAVSLPVQTPGGCELNPAGFYDRFEWPNNAPACNAVGGVFPSPQSTTPVGTPATFSAAAGRRTCVISN